MWISIDEAKSRLNVNPRQIRELVKNGKLTGYNIGWIIDKASVDNYVPDPGGRPAKQKRSYHRKQQPEQSTSHQPRLQEKEETKEKQRG